MEDNNLRNDEADLVQRATRFLETMMEKIGLAVTVEVSAEGRFLRVNISGKDAGELVVGTGAAAKSNALEAIQLLLGRSLLTGEGGRTIVVDSDGFRDARCKLLEGAADRLADTALSTGKNVAIYGMNSFDRRAIHLRLADRHDLQTDSEGEGASRTLLILARQDSRTDEGGQAPDLPPQSMP